MIDNDSDWRRAFFMRLAWVLGTLPLAFALYGFLVLPRNPSLRGPDIEMARFLLPFTSAAMIFLSIALFLGRWRVPSSTYSRQQWRLGAYGTSVLAIEILLCSLFFMGSCWILARFHWMK